MKEQDIIRQIEEQTKELPIPSAISPEAMKKMLDEHIEQQHTVTETAGEQEAGQNALSPDKSHRRIYVRRLAAACIALCLIGVFAIPGLLSRQGKNSDSLTESAAPDRQDTMIGEYAENGAAGETGADSGDDDGKELAYQTNLTSPASYDDYYDILKSAYDEYYEQISGVETYTDGAVSATEAATEAALESAAEDTAGISNNAADLRSSSSMKDASASGEAKQFSTTNTQEKSVDEGDIIKTDGTYIYKVITGFDQNTGYTTYRLTITKTDNGSLSTVTSFSLDDVIKKSGNEDIQFQEFYLYQNRLILMYSKSDYSTEPSVNETAIAIYDLTDKANPKKTEVLSQSGWYESSRISNGYLYTVSNFSDTSLEDKKAYQHYIPSVNRKYIECSDIYCPKNVLMETTYVVTGLNLQNPQDFTDKKAVPVSAGSLYVSDSSIYIYANVYADTTKTEIMKIGYDKGVLTVGNSAVVSGYLYDSFALSEYDGNLRIVATIPANNISLLRNSAAMDTDDTVVREDVNVLYILDEKMELIGRLTGLAPGEIIYSARFMGDAGYFVTYRNTDPLFSVDLSDPANPKLLGALKIPGFSNYLHFYGDNILLGIGQETDPDTQEFLGLKLSMFDISNPADVKEKDKYILENSDFSDALHNHKAIMIDTEKNIFGFMYCGTPSDYSRPCYYYVTYTYDRREGFIETASYKVDDGSEYEYDAVRGLYIGDYFYLATDKSITSYKIGSEDAIAQVYLR